MEKSWNCVLHFCGNPVYFHTVYVSRESSGETSRMNKLLSDIAGHLALRTKISLAGSYIY